MTINAYANQKTCTKCKQTKPQSSFQYYPSRDAYESHCKECRKAYARERYKKDREKIKEQQKKRRQNWHRRDPKARLRAHLKHKYNLTLEQYEALLVSQNHACSVCGRKETLSVDHNHQTGDVRSILCRPCNIVLGILKEDPSRLRALAAYIEKHSTQLT
jgi:hypothetical protein